MMPLTVDLSHKLVRQLSLVRKEGILPYLWPDGKSQVTVKYKGFIPVGISQIVIATQHDDMSDTFPSEEEEHLNNTHDLLKLEKDFPLLEADPWWLRYKALKIAFSNFILYTS